MTRKSRVICAFLILALLLSGCTLGTIDELYCLPKRSEEYENLQAVLDKAMNGLEYCAPTYGEFCQAMQTADLDGDGVEEYLLFAKDNSDKPLKVLIFCQLASGYVLMDTIEGYGFGYDFVDYAQMDDKPGLELVIGRQVSEQVPRAVAVYRFTSGFSRQLLSTSYSQIVTDDFDGDGISEIFTLSSGASGKSYGAARLYSYRDGELQPSAEILISASMTGFKQMLTGNLSDGTKAVYVTCATNNQNLVTDIFVVGDGHLTSLAKGLYSQTLHNYYVYPDDMDADGVPELPRLIPLDTHPDSHRQEYMVEWYTLDSACRETVKMRTYHNLQENWYLELSDELLQDLSVQQTDSGYTFYCANAPIFTIYTLTDADREEQSKLPNRLVLYSGESVIYAAELAEEESAYHDLLMQLFHPIRVDVNTERD